MKFYFRNLPSLHIKLLQPDIRDLIEIAAKEAGNLIKLSKILNTNKYELLNARRSKSGRGLKFTTFKKLLDFLEERKQNAMVSHLMENLILGKHGGIMQPKFPIDFQSKAGMIVLADILTDGSYTKFGKIFYDNKNPKLVVEHVQAVNELFTGSSILVNQKEMETILKIEQSIRKENKDIKIIMKSGEKILKKISERSKVKCNINLRDRELYNVLAYQVDWTTEIGNFLKMVGIPQGNHIYNNPPIPEIVYKVPSEEQYIFLARVIANEGSVNDDYVCITQTIDVSDKLNNANNELLKNNKNLIPNLLKGCQKLLSSFDISCKFQLTRLAKFNGEKHIQWELRIPISEFEKIENNIIIPYSFKQNKLSLLMFSRKKRMEKEKSIALKKLIKICKKLNKKGIQHFSIKDLSKNSRIKERTLYKYVKLAQEQSILKVVNGIGTLKDPIYLKLNI